MKPELSRGEDLEFPQFVGGSRKILYRFLHWIIEFE
jgi:hypothetical protein